VGLKKSGASTTDLAAGYPIQHVVTMPEVITLVPYIPFGMQEVVLALRDFPQFENIAVFLNMPSWYRARA